MKKKGALQRQYLIKKSLGGLFGKDPNGDLDTNKIGAVSSMGTGFINAIDPGDQDGVQSDVGAGLSGALGGAQAGAVLGPWGMAAGAVLGGLGSVIGNGKKKAAAEQKKMARDAKLTAQKKEDVMTAIIQDPTILGNADATMYDMGGTIKGKPAGKFALQGTLVGKYRAAQSLMPNISVRPNRMMQDGGKIRSRDQFAAFYGKDFKDKNYNTEQAYQIYKKSPSTFEKDFASKESDGWHFPTVDPSTGIFLKSKNHPTLKKELDWYNSLEGKEFREQNVLDTTGNYYRYLPKKENGGELGGEEKKWMVDYIKSPRYAQRIKRGGYENGYWKERENRLRNLKTVDVGKALPIDPRNFRGAYNPITHGVTVKLRDGIDDEGAVLHELSHATGALPNYYKYLNRPSLSKIDEEELSRRSTKDFKKNSKFHPRHTSEDGMFIMPDRRKNESKEDYRKRVDQAGIEFDLDSENKSFDDMRYSNQMSDDASYLNSPAELKASLDQSRFLLQKKGLFDSRKDQMTKEKLDKIILKLRTDRGDGGSTIQDVMSRFKSNDDYIWALNNIAAVDSPAKKYKEAKYGGVIPVDSEGRAVVEGPSHAEGGVKIPEAGVELEGGETLDGNFVFSKKLGFADKHKKIMKAISKTEKDDTPLSAYTRRQLDKKEDMLKIQQEELKQDLGIENEIDNEMNKKKYATGGKLPKRLADDYLNINRVTLPNSAKTSGVTLNTEINADIPYLAQYDDTVGGDKKATLTNDSTKSNVLDKLESVAPYASNLVNAFRKLPATPEPIMDAKVSPRYQDYSASRAEATRAVRSANKSAAQQLASSTATTATRAANLVSGIRAVNEVNQAENNVNANIALQTSRENAQIDRNNNSKLEYKAAQDVSRSLKQQELNAENLANFTDKLQMNTRDRNLRSLEDDKLMLQIAQDNTGASWRAGRDIFKRRLSPESFAALDARMKNIEDMNQRERELTLQALRNGLASVSGANVPSVTVQQSKKKK